jgi:hypothetical protein
MRQSLFKGEEKGFMKVELYSKEDKNTSVPAFFYTIR